MPDMRPLAFNETKKGREMKAKKIAQPHEDVPSFKGYRNGCRCADCKAENAKYQREYQANKKLERTRLGV